MVAERILCVSSLSSILCAFPSAELTHSAVILDIWKGEKKYTGQAEEWKEGRKKEGRGHKQCVAAKLSSAGLALLQWYVPQKRDWDVFCSGITP